MARSFRSKASRRARRSLGPYPDARPLRLEPLEDRRLLAALVGIDFGSAGVPANWTQLNAVGTTAAPTVRTNLLDETGAPTAIDLTISNTGPGDALSAVVPINAGTLPQHTPSIALVSNIVFVDSADGIHRFDARFSDLKPGFPYEVYVFALEDAFDGFVDSQTVTITGAGAPLVFQQSPVSANNLWVNDQVGSSAQPLENYRKLTTPNGAGQIDVRVQMNAGSDALVLAGLAIREVGLVVNDAGGGDDNNAANGVTTLREAVRLANSSPGADTITFAANMSDATIHLGGTEIAITEALTIDAAPLAQNVTIDAQQQSRIFNITTSSGDFTLTGLTLTGGLAIAGRGGAVQSLTSGDLTINETLITGNQTVYPYWYGGGIYAKGSVTLTQSTVSANATNGDGARGGGIYATGSVTLKQSTVNGNATNGIAADGGGIFSSAAVTLTQSTVSGNTITGDSARGGGIFAAGAATLVESTVSGNQALGPSFNNEGGGILAGDALTLIQSTVANNYATSRGGGFFQNQNTQTARLLITASIIAGNNTGSGVSPDLKPDPTSVAVPGSVSYSLIGDTSGSGIGPSTGTGNLLNVNPRLGPLADNGGPTKTHALLPGSPAIDVGPSPMDYFRFEETTGSVAENSTGPISISFENFTASTQSGPPAVGGNAAFLDGVDDYLTNFGLTDVNNRNQYSVELWFNATSVGGEQALVALSDGAGGHFLLLEIEPDGSVRFLSRPGGGNSGGDNLYTPAGAVVAGQWYHLAAVRDGAKMRIYLNGAEVAALASASTDTIEFADVLTLGRLSDTQSIRYFGGKLDEVAIHYRVLSAGEAALHASRGFVDQRGLFAVINGNGGFSARPDMGAYEAQAKPTADFDADGDVDGSDFLRWQRGFGKTAAAVRADGDSDADADADSSDLAAWRVQFGTTGLSATAASGATVGGAGSANLTEPSIEARDAAFAGDATLLFPERSGFRPLGKGRWRRG